MRLPTRASVLAVTALLAAMVVHDAQAAQRGGQRRGFGSREGAAPGGGGMESSFEGSSPAVGEAMPEVLVHRDNGEPISFRQLLSEHYTVVILGCLT